MTPIDHGIDALLLRDIALKAEAVGVQNTRMEAPRLLAARIVG